jgi:hypothetical protein
VVADSVVAARRSGTGVLCFALRLDDETALAETWYRLGTLERAIELGTDPPHLTWAK